MNKLNDRKQESMVWGLKNKSSIYRSEQLIREEDVPIEALRFASKRPRPHGGGGEGSNLS